ncbi:MAG: hypothetical protein QG565_589 [Campylobacterota bacterium]|nr:hypothetical protein [Campylobacterota bacterium]MDQ1338669.1 hypothetical protein [Campylobacterota bacterium]
MDIRAFENLELIPTLLKKIEAMEERLKKFTPPLTTKKEVARFLDVSERTINNYMAQGLLSENYHFYKKNGKILVFIEDAITEFRRELNRGIVNEEVKI